MLRTITDDKNLEICISDLVSGGYVILHIVPIKFWKYASKHILI
jgi:hypothetical protein